MHHKNKTKNVMWKVFFVVRNSFRKFKYLSSVAGRKAPMVGILAPPGPPALAAA